jgi:hypothetical protein
MRTVKRNPLLSGVCALLGGVFLLVGTAKADVTSDEAAAILVIPKVVYDPDGRFSPNLKPTDTEIQVTNVSDHTVKLRCFYVNATSHCSNALDEACFDKSDCQQFGLGGLCVPRWIETDFEFTLSKLQPIVWLASEGLTSIPLSEGGVTSGSIPPVSEFPFLGELKCVEVGLDDRPVDTNDLKGEATIVAASASGIDARGYNAIGVQAIAGANSGDNTLVLGGEEDPEYNGCPSVLILDHFFDDAVEPIDGDFVKTHLTCVPCSQNFETQQVFETPLQFLVFNEFEQRFSASRKLTCFHEFELCSLDQGWDRPIGNFDPNFSSCQFSIFSAFVSGTLTGQTRIRGVDTGIPEHGNGVLCVAEEFFRSDPPLDTIHASDAFTLQHIGDRVRADIIVMP